VRTPNEGGWECGLEIDWLALEKYTAVYYLLRLDNLGKVSLFELSKAPNISI
jgi:hypothetical protein